ncbi:MAG: YabP/YqfC family sporulation protein [Lachnospiraceae bacterium]
MSETKSLLKQELSDQLRLPTEFAFGTVVLRVNGQSEAFIENYKGILEYTQDKITLETKGCRVTILGKNLLVSYYTNDEMKITGQINEIVYR